LHFRQKRIEKYNKNIISGKKKKNGMLFYACMERKYDKKREERELKGF
jgi:hypothetical protein